MTQIRQRPAGEAGRGDDAKNVRAGQRQNTRPAQNCSSDDYSVPSYKPVFAQPPAVAPLSQSRHAPDLIRLYVADDWQSELTRARNEFERFGETTPALGLPLQTDPACYCWPVGRRNVAIYGNLYQPTLRRLLAALLRDGAAVAAGMNQHGVLHTAVGETAKEAA